jgi:hypothetical protein
VELGVVSTEVGEDGQVDDHGVDPVHHQGVRRHLEGDDLGTRRPQVGQVALELGSLGCRWCVVASGQGADGGCRPSCRGEDVGHQVGDGGLAVGAGDAHHGHARRRMTVELGGDRCHGSTAVGHSHLGDAEPERSFGDQGDGTSRDGLGGVVVAVGRGAPNAHEERALPHLARVV